MPTEWATKRSEEIVVAMLGYLHWNDVRALAAALDAAREQGEREERERWRQRVEAEAVRLEDEAAAARHKYHVTTAYVADQQADALRSLLSPAEVAGREEG